MSPYQANLLANQALAVAADLLHERFIGARFALVAGSIMRGEGTTGSDIDLIVVYPALERARREAFCAGGFPVEAFVYDEESLAPFLTNDVEHGRPVLLSMIAEGRLVGSDIAGARELRERAQALLAKGPAPLAGERLQLLRYQISDLLEDLRGARPAAELRAIALALYPKLADLMLLGRGEWTGAGKWLPRRLAAVAPELGRSFEAAFDAALGGDTDPLAALGRAELDLHGGPLFDGFVQLGPLKTSHA
ncbi:nucleotidyltransferase domain-containing protein [Devosia sp.]|uniref:nucleotidyltransferase domain-containing protein n=1 Tax=Devosia sp. TaxID=1871048 RepID=UPI001AC78A07|nr:nucleotidyltransferase domain-containing protein [Devosia sp.]MBN9332963.1 nucleotidyltransferase domain-containing protein [Devosia sp.]